MFRYVVRRVLLAALTLAAISVATFGVFFLGPANPGGLMCGTGPDCTEEQERRINEGLGLSRPPSISTSTS
jgi:peptide/nickel transport system permease protein